MSALFKSIGGVALELQWFVDDDGRWPRMLLLEVADENRVSGDTM